MGRFCLYLFRFPFVPVLVRDSVYGKFLEEDIYLYQKLLKVFRLGLESTKVETSHSQILEALSKNISTVLEPVSSRTLTPHHELIEAYSIKLTNEVKTFYETEIKSHGNSARTSMQKALVIVLEEGEKE